MKTKKAILVDDEPFVRDDLRHMLLKHPEIEIIGKAGSITEAVAVLGQVSPDVVFLDIQLRGGSGFDLVPSIPPPCRIIFFTAFDNYAVRVFEVNALDYLLKPVNPDRLATSLSKLNKNETQRSITRPSTPYAEDDQIFIHTAVERRFLSPNDISAIISLGGNYTSLLQSPDQSTTIRRTLKQWEQRLPPQLFCRIHRSAIVNLKQIQKLNIEKNGTCTLFLSGIDQPFEVSRRFSPRLRELFNH